MTQKNVSFARKKGRASAPSGSDAVQSVSGCESRSFTYTRRAPSGEMAGSAASRTTVRRCPVARSTRSMVSSLPT